MNLDEAVRKIAEKGFTERQARFLLLVARHSGVCVMRQYAAFAGIVFGHKTRKFFAKLEGLGWVSTYECAHNRWRIYHLRHRDVYEAIGEPHSRLRRPPTVPQAIERLMMLDALLKEPNLVWLASADEKLDQLSALTRVPIEAMPQVSSTVNGVEQVRYFPDRLPLGVDPAGRWVCVYLLTRDSDRDLRLFLERHLQLLAALPAWTLRIAVPPHLEQHGTRLVASVREQLRVGLQRDLQEDVRRSVERRRSRARVGGPADHERRSSAAIRQFSGTGFSALYTLWLTQGDAIFMTLSPISDALGSGAAVVEALVLPHAYSHLAPLLGVA
jgi:hypothetical protein